MELLPTGPIFCLFRALGLSAALALPVQAPAGSDDPPVTVFAAASLKTALDDIARSFEASGGAPVSLSYAGSSKLARQIQYGAPAQVFLSASADWMDLIESEGLLAPGTRRDLLTNRLVLVAAPGFSGTVKIGPNMDLAGALGDGWLAMALVDAVPAGQYGRAALETLGQWAHVSGRIAQADNVRAALRLVAAGEAPLGIVYATDAVADPDVRVAGWFPQDSHPPIRYPVAVLADGDTPEARAFATYLFGADAAGVFRRNGFGLVAEGS